jgi:hypothetical protein
LIHDARNIEQDYQFLTLGFFVENTSYEEEVVTRKKIAVSAESQAS